MKEIYTQKLLLFCCFILLSSSSLFSQYSLVVASSESVKDTYDLVLGAGAYPVVSTQSPLYYHPSLACDTLLPAAASSKIALIDRGTCAFAIKIHAAKKAGSTAVIICNDRVDAPIILDGTSSLNAAGTGFVTTRPSLPIFMASQADCAKIKASLTASDSLVASFENTGCSEEITYTPETFWGHIPGQGDFSNGFGGWTVNGISAPDDTFKILPGGITPTPSFNGNNYFFNSPSSCNGVAGISLVGINLVKMPALVRPYYETVTELISPTIDCSGKENVNVTFYTLDARLGGKVSYATSIDDGATWSEPIEFATANVVNGASKITEKLSFPIVAFTNQPTCKFKFIVDEADFYYFLVDDVTFNNKKVFDMSISKNFYSGAANYATPFNQGSPNYFTLDIENTGNVTAENVRVVLDIYDSTTDTAFVVHSDTLKYGSVVAGLRDADRVFTKTFTPAEKEAYYIAQYTLLADSVVLDADTDAQVDFETTNNSFSKIPDHISVLNGWRLNGSTNFMSVGANYKVKNGTWPNGKAITLDYGRGGAYVNPAPGINTSAIVTYDVYKWVDTNQDTFNIQGDERELIATGSVLIENSVDTVTIELFDPLDPSKKVVLPNESMNLVAVVSVSPIDETGATWFIGSVSPFDGDNSGRYHSYASALAEINSGASAIWTGSFYGSGTLDDVGTRVLEQSTLTAYAPLYFTEVDLVNNKEINKELKITAYPVPAVQNINVDLSFDKTEDYANVFITDMSGRIVHMEKHVNIQAKTLSIDLSNFAAGVYNLRVNTDSGFNTQNFSVVK